MGKNMGIIDIMNNFEDQNIVKTIGKFINELSLNKKLTLNSPELINQSLNIQWNIREKLTVARVEPTRAYFIIDRQEPTNLFSVYIAYVSLTNTEPKVLLFYKDYGIINLFLETIDITNKNLIFYDNMLYTERFIECDGKFYDVNSNELKALTQSEFENIFKKLNKNNSYVINKK